MKITPITYIETKHLNTVAAVLFAGIIATGTYGFLKLGPTSEEQSSITGSTTTVAEETFSSLQSVDQAQAESIATAKNPQVNVKKVETSTTEQGAVVHSVYFSDGTKVVVAADDGASSEPVPEATPQFSPEPATPAEPPVVDPEAEEIPPEQSPEETPQVQSSTNSELSME